MNKMILTIILALVVNAKAAGTDFDQAVVETESDVQAQSLIQQDQNADLELFGRGSVRTTIVKCESNLKLFKSCDVSGLILHAELVYQKSNSPCELGHSWGYDSRRIWVDRGCRAAFRVLVR